MDRDELVAELFGRWKRSLKSGQPQTPEELCISCPELLTTFRDVLPQLAAVDALFDDTTDVSKAALETHVKPSGYHSLSFHKEGGLGVVLVGEEVELRRTVAIKCMKSKAPDDSLAKDRFVREAELTARLDHPGVVPIYRMGRDEQGKPYYSMRFVQGETLAEAIARFYTSQLSRAERNVEYRRLLRSMIAVCETVAFAHSRKVIHRDLKPDNIILGPFGETLVLDWGLAKRIDVADLSSDSETSTDASISGLDRPNTRTIEGTIKGAPAFMSPEQARGEAQHLDPRTDIYSLGATLFVLLTGKSPYTGGSVLEIVAKVKAGPSPSARQLNPEVDKPLEAICRKAMSHNRDDRYADARELAHDLDRWLAGEPVSVWREPWTVRTRRWMKRHRPVVAAISTALMIVTMAAVGFAIQQRRNSERERSERERADASAAAERVARGQADEKTKEARRNLYIAHMNLAQVAWENSQVRRVQELLAHYRPEPGTDDLRGFEWHYWNRLCQSSVLDPKIDFEAATGVAFSVDGKYVAATSKDHTVKLWDFRTGELKHILKGHTWFLNSVTFSPDGSRLASTSNDRTVIVWETSTGRKLHTLRGHKYGVTSVAFSPDGKRLASTGGDSPMLTRGNGEIKVWDASNGQMLLSWDAYCGSNIAFGPDGNRLATGNEHAKVALWDASTGKLSLTLDGHLREVTSVAFSPDGERIASASEDRTVKVWDLKTGKKLLTLQGHAGTVTSVKYSGDGKRLVTASDDQTVKLWNAADGLVSSTWKGHTGRVTSATFSGDGRRVFSVSEDHSTKVWDATSDQEKLTFVTSVGHLTTAAFSLDGKWVASAGGIIDDLIRVFSAISGQELFTLPGHRKGAERMTFSPDGKLLVSSGRWDGKLKVWDTSSRQELFALEGPMGGGSNCVAFIPDGKQLATTVNDTVKVWEISSNGKQPATNGRKSFRLEGHTEEVTSVTFSPDGKWLASASADHTVRVWNLLADRSDGKALRETFTLKEHTGSVTCVAFSADGKRLASASEDRTVKIWDLPADIHDAAKRGSSLTLMGHGRKVTCVAFAADGQRIASASGEPGAPGEVKFWDAISGQETLTLHGHLDHVASLAFSADGRRLMTADGGGRILFWDSRTWTPELSDESQALSMIRFLRNQETPKADWPQAIQKDPSISESVRKLALQFARE